MQICKPPLHKCKLGCGFRVRGNIDKMLGLIYVFALCSRLLDGTKHNSNSCTIE